MKISEALKVLEAVKADHGDVDVFLGRNTSGAHMAFPAKFACPARFPTGEMVVEISDYLPNTPDQQP